MTSHLNYLSRLLPQNSSDLNDGRNAKVNNAYVETSSLDSTAAEEMESYAWIDRMWKKYTAEGLAKQPKPSGNKLARMIWAKI